MTTNEMNKHIKNYLEHDETNRAIMLDGPWGSGKSYYIKQYLVKALEKDGKNRCAIVSLYGLNNVQEISKSIYLEIRGGFLNKKSEALSVGKFVGQTIVKGVSSFFGVDLSTNGEKLQEIYDSIDLKGKLVILEDLERTSIPILEVLGFVNNLVEQDGVKVLLVANEEEIINNLEKRIEKKKTTIVDITKNNEKYDEEGYKEKETYDYLRQKEKTIGDTIIFQCDVSQTVTNIIKSKKFQLLECLLRDNEIMRMIIYETEKKTNFRSFIYACQKTNDIFNQYIDFSKKTIKDEFIKFVFVGVLKYVNSKDSGEDNTKSANIHDDIAFDENILLSTYSIVPFAKEYIEKQQLDFKKIEEWEKLFEYHNISEFNKQKEQDVRMAIQNYYISDKSSIMTALRLEEELLQQDQVPIKYYRVLVSYLFAIKWKLNDPKMNPIIFECLESILKNVDNVSDENIFLCFEETMWRNINISVKVTEKAEYDQFVDSLYKAIEKKIKEGFSTDYSKDDFNNFISDLEEAQRTAYSNKVFIQKIDIKKLVDNLFTYTSKQIYQLRLVFNQVYNVFNWNKLLPADEKLLVDLKTEIVTGIRTHNDMELVQKYQISLFKADLEKYLNNKY